jgi:SAM-dependent methyltransferase
MIARQLACPSGLVGRWFTAGWLDRANLAMNRSTLEQLHIKQGDRVLEIGFGGGDLLAQILSDGRCEFVAGVDRSIDMVHVVEKRLQRIAKGKFEVRVGDIENLPDEDGSFTKLCSVNTLYFWRQPSVAMAECRRVLQHGGRMVLCFNSKENLIGWPVHKHGFRLYELEEVENMFTDAGFVSVDVVSESDQGQVRFYCVSGIAG